MGIAVDSRIELSYSHTIEAVKIALKANLVPLVRSSPGIGKSSMGHFIAQSLNLAHIDVRLADHEPSDLNGLPDVRGEYAVFKTFEQFPTEEMQLPEGKDGWLLCFDELPNVDKQMQSAAYKIILEKFVGQKRLHPKCKIIAFGNHTTDNAIAEVMSTALCSRLIHLNLRFDFDDFISYALSAGISSNVIAYLHYKKSSAYNFDPNKADETYPCPRTWEFLSKSEKAGLSVSAPWALAYISGTIGQAVAHDYVLFMNYRKELVTFEQMMLNPDTCDVYPNQPHLQYAMASLLAENFGIENIENILKVVSRLSPEFASFVGTLAMSRIPPAMHAQYATNTHWRTWLSTFIKKYVTV